ncbi:MAG: DUF3667 domain-containing protein [Planctomycetota bacterium]
MPDAAPTTCPNCGTPQAGRYCPRCGQDNGRLELRLTTALVDAAQALFSVEGAMWRTVRGLTVHPGKVARDYLEGQRARYVHPVRYAILTCGLWWAAINFGLRNAGEIPPILRHGNWLNLAMMPILVTGMWLPFLGGRRTWLQMLFVMLLAAGHIFLWRAPLALLGLVLPSAWGPAITIADGIAAVLYTGCTLWFAYRGRARWLLLRVLAALAVFVVGTNGLIQLAIRLL